MGMNPDTNKFENLNLPDGFTEDSGGEFFRKLVRPDGTPVPKHWTVFSVDEEVVIKNYTFKVGHIGESHILFEPVGVPEIGPKQRHQEVLKSNPKRRK